MMILKGHKRTVSSVTFTPDGQRLASCGGDSVVRLWDLDRGLEEVSLWIGLWRGRIAIDPSGRFLAQSGERIRVWDISAGCTLLLHSKSSAQEAQFSPDGSYLAGPGALLRRWDTRSWQELPEWGGRHHGGGVGGLAFGRGGSLLAIAYNRFYRVERIFKSIIQFWDARTGERRGELECPTQRTGSMVFGRDDGILVCLQGSALSVWSASEGREVTRCVAGTRDLTGLSITPDGRFLATVDRDKIVRIWDSATWQERMALDWEIGKLQTIAFAPDGMRAAAAGSSGKIVIWDVDL
jgi:WD40 repeat protein